VIARKTLREFWERHPDAREALVAWFREAELATWSSPQELKRRYPSASFLAGDRVVFNVRGNRYRIVVAIRYPLKLVFIRFVGTHAAYDAIDAEEI